MPISLKSFVEASELETAPFTRVGHGRNSSMKQLTVDPVPIPKIDFELILGLR